MIVFMIFMKKSLIKEKIRKEIRAFKEVKIVKSTSIKYVY